MVWSMFHLSIGNTGVLLTFFVLCLDNMTLTLSTNLPANTVIYHLHLYTNIVLPLYTLSCGDPLANGFKTITSVSAMVTFYSRLLAHGYTILVLFLYCLIVHALVAYTQYTTPPYKISRTLGHLLYTFIINTFDCISHHVP